MKLGFMEIIVILVVALLIIGPDKLPYYTKKLGVALKEFRKVSESVTKEVRENVVEPLEEASAPLREAIEPLEDLKKDIEGNFKSVERDLNNIGKTKKDAPAKKDQAKTEEKSPEEASAPLEEPVPVEEAPVPQAENVEETPVSAPVTEENPAAVSGTETKEE